MIGGNSVREHFHDPADFAPMVEDREGPESCNTYNMLRLTRALAERRAAARAPGLRRAGAVQPRAVGAASRDGGFVYFTSMRPGHYRVYSQRSTSASGAASARASSRRRATANGSSARVDGALAINLFVPATLDAPEFGGRVRIETDVPSGCRGHGRARSRRAAHAFAVRLRVPAMGVAHSTTSPSTVSRRSAIAVPGAIVIEREWQPGARITFRVPLVVRRSGLPDGSAWRAFLAGPVVLAARGDGDGLVGLRGDDARWGHVAGGPLRPLADVPIVADAAAGDLLTETAPLRYGCARPIRRADVELEPFAGIHDARYTVYWPVAAASAEVRRAELQARDLDASRPTEPAPYTH